MKAMAVREYATKERISLGSAYRRIWEGRVQAHQVLGRWVITPDHPSQAGEVDEGSGELNRDQDCSDGHSETGVVQDRRR
jgi:hypothetical protein